MINDSLLWTTDEYQAVVDYKANYYSAINVLLSNNITMREIKGNDKSKKLPHTAEEFRKAIEKAVLLYSAIRKNYDLNGCKEYNKTLFRGTRDGKIDMSFLSTSDSARTAFDFAKMFEQMSKGNGTLLVIESGNVPWIDISSVIPNGDGIEEEPEILFLPSQIDNFDQVSLEECFDIAKKQGERIPAEQAILRKFDSLRCGKVTLSELDYSSEKTDLSIDDLCSMYEQYKQDLGIIRGVENGSAEYNEAFQRILQFKKNCCSLIHQRFYEINQSIDNQINIENSNIQLYSEFDMREVSIGNTGEMYYIKNRVNDGEYYFKPAISKNGADRPYRAYIQESAYRIQQIINPEGAVKCNTIEINGMFGAIQEKIPINAEATKAFREYFNKGNGELPSEIISQVIDEYLVDFCLCNYDSHASNFIIDENGRLRGIDKEQSFRYINEDSKRDMMFSTNYNESYGENPAIYNTLFEQMKQGKLSYKYLETLRYRASRLSQFPDEQYRKIFEKYAYGKAKTPEDAEKLLSSILDRKSNILQNIEQLYNDIYNEWYRNKGFQKSSSILDSAVQATEEITRTGIIDEQVNDIRNIQKGKIQQKNENYNGIDK